MKVAPVPFPVDFRAAVAYTESQGYGPLDAEGIPLVRYQSGKTAYNPTTVAQYALGLHQLWTDAGKQDDLDKFFAQATWFLKRFVERSGGVTWMYDFDYPLYRCRRPWTSGLAQAQVLSVLVRALPWLEGTTDVATVVPRAAKLMLTDVSQGGFAERDEDGNFWWAEYPCVPQAGVLNGHMFAIISMLEVSEVTADPQLQAACSQAVRTACRLLPEYDTGRWVRYDRHHRALASTHYLRHVYLPLLQALHQATGEPRFLEYEGLWRRYSRFPYPELYMCEAQLRRGAALARVVLRRVAGLSGKLNP